MCLVTLTYLTQSFLCCWYLSNPLGNFLCLWYSNVHGNFTNDHYCTLNRELLQSNLIITFSVTSKRGLNFPTGVFHWSAPGGRAVYCINYFRPLEHWGREFESHSRHKCLYALLYIRVVLCVGSCLATGWSPVKAVLPTVYRVKKLKKRPMPKGL
jgi:hypothetical protein